MRKLKSREEGEIGLESREKGNLLPCPSPLLIKGASRTQTLCWKEKNSLVWSGVTVTPSLSGIPEILSITSMVCFCKAH